MRAREDARERKARSAVRQHTELMKVLRFCHAVSKKRSYAVFFAGSCTAVDIDLVVIVIDGFRFCESRSSW
eukprot:2489638-Rhodomonas_salina.2